MIRAALLALLLAAPAAAQVPPPGAPPDSVRVLHDAWLARDKALHAGVSFGLAAGGALALRHAMDARAGDAASLAAGTALAIGVVKEVHDARRPRGSGFSWRDLVADAVGALLGAAVASL